MASKQIKDYIDIIERSQGRSEIQAVTFNSMFGLNYRNNSTINVGSSDTGGLVFFGRPDYHLSDNNLAQHRTLSTLLTKESASIPRAIRAWLDRRGCYEQRQLLGSGDYDVATSPLVDERNTFIPILSNQCVSLSGFQDTTLEALVSEAGLYGEQHALAEGYSDDYSFFRLTATFDEVDGKIISSLFAYQALYISLMRDARIYRHPENALNGRVDYPMRITHLTLNANKRKVTGIYTAPIAFPLAINDGAQANYQRDVVVPTESNQVSVQFGCLWGMKYDPIQRIEFNRLVAASMKRMYVDESLVTGDMSNLGSMSEYEQLSGNGMILLNTHDQLSRMNYRAFPRISMNMDMEWWVAEEDWKLVDERISDFDDLKQLNIFGDTNV